MTESSSYLRGLEVRREILGDQRAQQTRQTGSPHQVAFSEVITEIVWGVIWARPGLDRKTKCLICIVTDIAIGRAAELPIHFQMALRFGWTESELTEVLLQLIGYVGGPRVREAILIANDVFTGGESPTEASDSATPAETSADRQSQGAAQRRLLLGDEEVDRLNQTVSQGPLKEFLEVETETTYGALWTRPGLDLKTRTLVCVVLDAAAGRPADLPPHLEMALRQGWTEKELIDALIHLIAYIGGPTVREAVLTAIDVFAKREPVAG